MSALTRMAAGDFNKVVIGQNDTIIISANPIPGNEKPVYRVINNLYKKGARVIYESLEKIHVSGHACQEEHKILHSLLKPKFSKMSKGVWIFKQLTFILPVLLITSWE